MKRSIIFIMLFTLMLAGIRVCADGTGQKQEVFEAKESGVVFTVPEEWNALKGTLEYTDLDGNHIRSEELFAGHPLTMINLWATWCGPCIAELPELEKLSKELEEKNCRVIGIVTDGNKEGKIGKAKDILADKGVSYLNLVPFEGMGEQLPQDSWPTSYFVDENGVLIGEPVGGALPNKYRQIIDEVLTEG